MDGLSNRAERAAKQLPQALVGDDSLAADAATCPGDFARLQQASTGWCGGGLAVAALHDRERDGVMGARGAESRVMGEHGIDLPGVVQLERRVEMDGVEAA